MIAVTRDRLATELRTRIRIHEDALAQLPADEPEAVFERALHERAISSLGPVAGFLGQLSGSDPRLQELQRVVPTAMEIVSDSGAGRVLDELEVHPGPTVPFIWFDRFVAACAEDHTPYRVF